jgi:hypothetical protein
LELELGFVYVEFAAAVVFTWARPKALVLTASSCSATVDSRSVSFQNYCLLSLLSGFSTLRFVTCLFDKSNNCAS